MAGAQRGGVTPAGVREGRPDTLRALVGLRGPAVLAFCREVCAPDDVARAAAEAFARFRAAVVDTPEMPGLDPDRLLLSATRHAAAALVGAGAPDDARLSEDCVETAALLAARASGVMGEDERHRLVEHLTACPACRELEARFTKAEDAYQHPPVAVVAEAEETVLLVALTAAAPLMSPEEAAAAETVPAVSVAPPVVASAPVRVVEPEPEPVVEPEPEPVVEPEPEPVSERHPEPADDADPEPWHTEPDDDGPWSEPDPEEERQEDPYEPVTAVLPALTAQAPEPQPPTAPDPPAAPLEPGPEPGIVPEGERETETDRELQPEPQAVVATAPEQLGVPLSRRLRSTERRERRDPRTLLLPSAVVVAGLLLVLALAGVFGDDDGAPPQAREVAPALRIEAPVTTPLPIIVTTPEPEPAPEPDEPIATPDETDPSAIPEDPAATDPG